MDFLDPKKQKAHSIRLTIGYALMGVALLLATTVLLYRAYGFGLDKDGRVIQNGLVFISSQPNGADVYVNGKKYKDTTNTRVVLPGGQYTFELKRKGYTSWKRAITVEGGSVGRFDYPLLFPTKLATTTAKQYAAAPLATLQSPDRRWLLVQTLTPDQFDSYDLGAQKPVPKPLTVPPEILSAGTTQDWEVKAWADDNIHVVLARTYQKGGQSAKEYILFNREDPAASRNLSEAFGFTPTDIELQDEQFNQYYLFDQNSGQLLTATLDEPTPQPYLTGVLEFATDGDTVLYATAAEAPAGKIFVRLRNGTDPSVTLRQLSAGSKYLLELADYKNAQFVAAGVQEENRVYVYKNPLRAYEDDPKAVLAPVQILKVEAPSYVSFSPGNRFAMAQNADRFAVYDAETDKGYGYQLKLPLDAPQAHASWADGYHLQMVSNRSVLNFDFDGANKQVLVAANPGFSPAYDRSYEHLYVLDAQNALTSTALLTPEDQ